MTTVAATHRPLISPGALRYRFVTAYWSRSLVEHRKGGETLMGDDRGQHPGSGGRPSRGRATGSSVLTPPTGLPVVPDDARVLADAVSSGYATAAPTPPGAVVAPCLCGHGADAHRHWRRGSDCGTCEPGTCTVYRACGGVVRRLLRGVGLLP